jgi:hypothetical protein
MNICFCPELKEADFENCLRLNNFSSCKHVRYLRIHSRYSTMDLMPLAGIPSENGNLGPPANRRVLSIGSCLNLKVDFDSTEGLHNITGSVTIDCCRSLHHLLGLQNIPEIEFSDYNNIWTFSGLGNHERLAINIEEKF